MSVLGLQPEPLRRSSRSDSVRCLMKPGRDSYLQACSGLCRAEGRTNQASTNVVGLGLQGLAALSCKRVPAGYHRHLHPTDHACSQRR